ncbi:hypothetical protein GPALN_006018 [Globodera pallida]|nr:hypothetical protein GPALN_006018 [Globodera pallida]
MHWGHAVSKDLINWVHLPIFMIPPNLLHLDFENGHFTGSIINLPNGEFGVFWSQRISYFPRGTVTEYPWRETQQYVMTKDLIRPDWTTHKMIIEKLPTVDPPIGNNFHDPVVFLGPGGYYYMTVGSERTGGSAGVVLLYKNKNKRADQLDRDWEYQGILHEDNRDELRMCECPMFIAMGDPLNANTEWVLSYVSDKGSYYPTVGMDAEGRARMNSLFVGHFDGRKFEHRFEQKMDFVGGSFAYQGFYDQQSGRAYLIGWICDIGWIGDTTGDPNFDGRGGEFVLSENGQYLMVRPLPELASLREKKPHVITKGQEFHLEKGQAELVFEFSWDNGREETFELHLTPTHTNGKKLELRIDNNGIELKRTWSGGKQQTHGGLQCHADKIHIFIDLDTVEYFADDGRWSGAIRLPEASQEKRIGTVEFYKETQQQNGGGHSAALIVTAVLLNCVGIPGFLMNFSVIYVTIKNRTLHGSANFLLALSSLFEMGHQAGHLVFLWLALSGQNFISYALCFRLMAFPSFSLSSKYVHLLTFHCAFCLASCIYHTLSLGHCAELYPSYPVTGYINDLFIGICSTLLQPAFLLNVATIFLYLIVGMYIWRQPTSSQFRIFRSLAVIVVANIGGYVFESINSMFVLQNLHLSNQMFWYITSYDGIILNMSSACNAIVLFCLSKDYRAPI